jgi:spore coat protein U-like protein
VRLSADPCAAMLTVAVLASWVSCGVAHAGCTVWATPIPIGDYDASAAEAVIMSADIEVRCDDSGIDFDLAFGPSAVSGSVVDRRMRHVFRADTLRYNLYHDPHAMRLWGDSDATMFSGTAVRGLTLVQVFARIDPGQDVWVGEYSDEVVLTVLP